MRFLVRMAFWLGLVILLLPAAPSQGDRTCAPDRWDRDLAPRRSGALSAAAIPRYADARRCGCTLARPAVAQDRGQPLVAL